jgi:ABC-2 type transport system ATP-binding protein
MIKIENVSKTYGKDFVAVDHINLEIKDGEIFGFLGPNGAGKTTTLKMITGITNITSGEIFINGKSIKTDDIAAKREFGFVPDSPDVLLRLKGIEYLNFIASIYGVSKELREKRIKDLATRFEMTDALGDKIQNYSHGMRQKMLVIGVLLHDPAVWILDEPLTGLDPKSSFTLKEMMREHARNGKTVFFSTHVLEVAEKLCDRIAIIDKGKIIFVGTMDELKKHSATVQSLESLFLELTDHE